MKKKAKVFVSMGQNLVDLALQETGSVEGIISLIKRNGYELDDDPVSGEEIKIDEAEVVSLNVRDFYKGINYKVNTSDANGEDLTGDITADTTELSADSDVITADQTIY